MVAGFLTILALVCAAGGVLALVMHMKTVKA
ncbi:hypothetical protein Dthio_PD2261 [Desulfonatronospira thiodismutans ASO3-1]|uniref:Uncharacterized protein n=1 Tax=Desulfonatronospira thiodismutans ASO3-1 TaxID=555779 RepID=D6SQ44_9BACT|nr:hypothetical protein Dthio_PD2261 [Desulfonatronospira thiodismutans ASO3-1]